MALHCPNVVVCDIGLPGEDGYQLLASIRKREGEGHTPRVGAVAVTAFARDDDRRHALEAGFAGHAPKARVPRPPIAVLTKGGGAPPRGAPAWRGWSLPTGARSTPLRSGRRGPAPPARSA